MTEHYRKELALVDPREEGELPIVRSVCVCGWKSIKTDSIVEARRLQASHERWQRWVVEKETEPDFKRTTEHVPGTDLALLADALECGLPLMQEGGPEELRPAWSIV